MIPPTPTLIPDGTPIGVNFGLPMWDVAPQIVQWWNVFSDFTPGLQLIIMLFLLLGLLTTIIWAIKRVSEEEE